MDPFDPDPPIDPDRRYTVGEYLAYELSAQWWYDYYNGFIRPKVFSTPRHSRLRVNVLCAIADQLDDSPYEMFGGEMRVAVDPDRCFLHPDWSIVTVDPQLMPPADNVSILEPRVLIEVYTAESEADDRGDRFARYRQIASLQEYVLVAEPQVRAETFHRQPDGRWSAGPAVTTLDGAIRLASVGIEMPMARVYSRVGFPPGIDE